MKYLRLLLGVAVRVAGKVLTIIPSADIIISLAVITCYVIFERSHNAVTNSAPALTEAVYYILLSLLEPLHGYGIMQNVETLSRERVRLAAGTLYGAISTMLEKGWIRALPGQKDSRRKEYVITESGRKVLTGEIMRLQELITNGKNALGGLSK